MIFVRRMEKVYWRISNPISVGAVTGRRRPIHAPLERVGQAQPVADLVHGRFSTIERREIVVLYNAAFIIPQRHVRPGSIAVLEQISAC